MALTQARASGAHAGGRYGSFAGKADSAGHEVGTLTQCRAGGAHVGGRYGSFAGRGDTGRPAGITQCRSHGAYAGGRYGDFSGRLPHVEPEQPPIAPVGIGGPPRFIQIPAHRNEDEAWLLMISQMVASGLIH